MTDNPHGPGLNICMLLPIRRKKNMLVYPSIQILSNVTRFGHRITWVIASEEDRRLETHHIDDVQVYAIPFRFYLPGNSIFAKTPNRILNNISRIRHILKIFRREQFDVVLVRHQVFPLDGLIALYLKRKYKIPFVLELPNPLDHRDEIKLNYPKQKSIRCLIARIDMWFTTRLVNRADLILPISQWLARDLVETNKISPSRILTIPEGVDDKLYINGDPQKICNQYGLTGSQVIIYEGEMGRSRKLDILIKAFLKVVTLRPGTKLLMVGNGNDRDNLQKLAAKLGIAGDVIFTGNVAQSDIPNFISVAAIGVSPIPPLTFYKFSSPIKVVEYLASAKPVVANQEIPDHQDILRRSGAGILVSFDSDAFARAIIELLDNPKKAVAMGEKGREWVKANRSLEVLARPLAAAYSKLETPASVAGMPS